MDWNIFWTILGMAVGTVLSLWGIIYAVVRNFKMDIKDDIIKLDNRIFQLAMGKTLKEILKEEKE